MKCAPKVWQTFEALIMIARLFDYMRYFFVLTATSLLIRKKDNTKDMLIFKVYICPMLMLRGGD